MNKPRNIAAIDMGSSKFVCLIGQVVKDENDSEAEVLNIAGAASVDAVGVKKGQIVNIEQAVTALLSSVESAERMAGIDVTTATVSIGGGSIMSENSHGVVAISSTNGEINQKDSGRVLESASAVAVPDTKDIIHVIPKEYIVDGEGGVKDPVGMSGVRLEVNTHMVTASTAVVKNFRKVLAETGIEVSSFVYTGLAASCAILTNTEKDLGSVLVDIGAGTTSIAVFSDGSLVHAAVIPIGARNVTNDLAIGLRVTVETAEKIKLMLSEEKHKKVAGQDIIDLSEYGINEIKKVSRSTLSDGIIKPRLNEIFSMVRLELEKAGMAPLVPSGAVITGGGALTIGAVESAKRSLSMPVRLGVPSNIGGLSDDILNPLFSVSIGLLLYKMHSTRQQTGNFPRFDLSDKIKLPSKGMLNNFISTIKELLP